MHSDLRHHIHLSTGTVHKIRQLIHIGVKTVSDMREIGLTANGQNRFYQAPMAFPSIIHNLLMPRFKNLGFGFFIVSYNFV